MYADLRMQASQFSAKTRQSQSVREGREIAWVSQLGSVTIYAVTRDRGNRRSFLRR